MPRRLQGTFSFVRSEISYADAVSEGLDEDVVFAGQAHLTGLVDGVIILRVKRA